MLLPFYISVIGRCYCQCMVADVKPPRPMLLPTIYLILLADVIAMHLWQMLSPPNAIWEHVIYGWCYCHMCARCCNHWCWCYCLCIFILIGWCYCQCSGRCYNHFFSILCWLMLLPSGRWNSHCRVEDGKWLMLLPLGRCYSPGSMILFQFKFGMLSRTSSHICGRWYLPTFLFRDDCWPWCKEPLLLLSWGSGPPFPQCWNFQHLCCDQWC